MIDFNRENYETAGARSDRQAVNSLPFSRRSFLVKTSYFGACYGLAKLIPSPADGRFACVIAQMDNGKRIDKGAKYSSNDDALRGGLEELRAFLGW